MKLRTSVAAIVAAAFAVVGALPQLAGADMNSNPSAQNRATATKGSPAGGESSEMHKGMHGKAAGAHSMKGTVEDLDTQTGMVTLKTNEGELKLHFPPKSLAQIKKGDQIQVHLSFTPAT